jgi:hypothetical protein
VCDYASTPAGANSYFKKTASPSKTLVFGVVSLSVLSSVLLPAQLGGTFGQSAWNSKAFGQCRRPFLHLEAAWVQAAKLLAARLQVAGCRAAGCRVAGCKGWATGCRVDLGSSRKGAETLYCCIFRFKIHHTSRAPALPTSKTIRLSQNQRLNRAQAL